MVKKSAYLAGFNPKYSPRPIKPFLSCLTVRPVLEIASRYSMSVKSPDSIRSTKCSTPRRVPIKWCWSLIEQRPLRSLILIRASFRSGLFTNRPLSQPFVHCPGVNQGSRINRPPGIRWLAIRETAFRSLATVLTCPIALNRHVTTS